jgi:hypothetical protein
VTRTAIRRNTQCGQDEIRATIGHAKQATMTPIAVSFP